MRTTARRSSMTGTTSSRSQQKHHRERTRRHPSQEADGRSCCIRRNMDGNKIEACSARSTKRVLVFSCLVLCCCCILAFLLVCVVCSGSSSSPIGSRLEEARGRWFVLGRILGSAVWSCSRGFDIGKVLAQPVETAGSVDRARDVRVLDLALVLEESLLVALGCQELRKKFLHRIHTILKP